MTDQPSPREAELTKLADGSLPPDREAELRAYAGGSSHLTAALAEQERAVALLHSVDEPAPASLRARVDALTESGGRRRRRTWRVLAVPAATALAVIIAAVVILAGGSSTVSVLPQATHFALSAATLPAPAVDRAHPGRLTASSDGIAFANLRGWRPVGARVDRVDGHRVVTVFYQAADGARVGYGIVSRPSLENDDKDTGYTVSYTLGRQGSGRLVTWVRDGRTCVIAGRNVTYQTLLHLARASNGAESS